MRTLDLMIFIFLLYGKYRFLQLVVKRYFIKIILTRKLEQQNG